MSETPASRLAIDDIKGDANSSILFTIKVFGSEFNQVGFCLHDFLLNFLLLPLNNWCCLRRNLSHFKARRHNRPMDRCKELTLDELLDKAIIVH